MTIWQILSLLIAVAAIPSAPADEPLIAYEGFDYPINLKSISGSDGGSGFQAPWTSGGFNSKDQSHLSLVESTSTNLALKTTGHAVLGKSLRSLGGLTRLLATPEGRPDTTTYFSILLEPGPNFGEGVYGGFFGLCLEGPANQALHFGASSRSIRMETRGGAGQAKSEQAPLKGQTLLLVVKAEFSSGKDRFTLFVNPMTGHAEPESTLVKTDLDLPEVRAITIYSTGSFLLDEIRIGRTFESVTPAAVLINSKQPEPAMETAAASTLLRDSSSEIFVGKTKIVVPWDKKEFSSLDEKMPVYMKNLKAAHANAGSNIHLAFTPVEDVGNNIILKPNSRSVMVMSATMYADKTHEQADLPRLMKVLRFAAVQMAEDSWEELAKKNLQLTAEQKTMCEKIDAGPNWCVSLQAEFKVNSEPPINVTAVGACCVRKKLMSVMVESPLRTNQDIVWVRDQAQSWVNAILKSNEGPVDASKVSQSAPPPKWLLMDTVTGKPLPMEIVEVDVTGATFRIPYPKTRYIRLRTAYPELFKNIVSKAEEIPTYETFIEDGPRAGQAQQVSFQSIVKSFDGQITQDQFFSLCGDGSSLKRRAEKELKEIEDSGLEFSEKQRAIHGLFGKEKDAVTESLFSVLESGEKRVLYLSVYSFMYLKERAVMLHMGFEIQNDKNMDAGLDQVLFWRKAIVEMNKSED